jgi:hypothetical protein
MKVKIGNKIYNEEDEPILLILNSEEKNLIKNMSKEDCNYCSYPDNGVEEEIIKFMKV